MSTPQNEELSCHKVSLKRFITCWEARYLKDVKTYIAKLIDIRMETQSLKLDLRRLEWIFQWEPQRKLVRETLIHCTFCTLNRSYPCENAVTFRKCRYSKISSTHLHRKAFSSILMKWPEKNIEEKERWMHKELRQETEEHQKNSET